MALGVAIFERFQKLLLTDEFRNLWNTTVDHSDHSHCDVLANKHEREKTS